MPSGLRVNWTALASARYSRWRETAALIMRPKKTPMYPSSQHVTPASIDRGKHAPAATATAAAAATSDFEQKAARECDQQQPEQDADEAGVEPHVAIQNMRELMRDHALQFVTRQSRQRAAGHSDHCVLDRVTGGKSVDGGFVVHHEHAWHRYAGGNRHFLDHVEEAAIEQVAGGWIDLARTHHFGDDLTAAPQRVQLPRRAAGDQRDDGQRDS
jgi:hypothetical protein